MSGTCQCDHGRRELVGLHGLGHVHLEAGLQRAGPIGHARICGQRRRREIAWSVPRLSLGSPSVARSPDSTVPVQIFFFGGTGAFSAGIGSNS
jgi:hypothetical protein